MLRFILILIVAGLYLIGSGGYELFIQAGTSRQPTTISMADLQKGPPSNRHLIVTGGRLVLQDAVTFYKTKWGHKVSGSEIFFIPVRDASPGAGREAAPLLILRMPEDQVNDIRDAKGFNPNAIEGIRTTSFDLEDKARGVLVSTYGQEAVDRMLILDYHGKVGIAGALGKLAGGLLLVLALGGFFLLGRKAKPAAPPSIPTAVPPVIPSNT